MENNNSNNHTNILLGLLTGTVIFFLLFEIFVNTENVNRVPDPPLIQQVAPPPPPEQKQNVVVNVTTPRQVAPPPPTTIVVPVQRRRRNNNNNNNNYRRRNNRTNTPSINFNPSFDLRRERETVNVEKGAQFIDHPGGNSQQVQAEGTRHVEGPGSKSAKGSIVTLGRNVSATNLQVGTKNTNLPVLN